MLHRLSLVRCYIDKSRLPFDLMNTLHQNGNTDLQWLQPLLAFGHDLLWNIGNLSFSFEQSIYLKAQIKRISCEYSFKNHQCQHLLLLSNNYSAYLWYLFLFSWRVDVILTVQENIRQSKIFRPCSDDESN